jgi:glucose/mannose-6-phosphate isomerase
VFNLGYDNENMIKVLDSFPEQCKEAIKLARGVKIKGSFDSIAVCGMGGSGIGADLLKSLVNNIPVYPIHGYNVPSYINKKTLFVAVSYSGNTEETIACFKEAKRRKCTMLSITSGGKLSELDKKAVLVPKGFQPRNAIGYLFLTMVAVLSNSKIIPNQSAAISEVMQILNPKKCSREGFLLANKLREKIPVFYSSEELAMAAYRIKTAVNENSKQPAFYHYFPEMNHNEMNGFGNNSSRLVAVFMVDKRDIKQIQRRMEITKQVIREQVKFFDMEIKGKSLLARMMFAIYVGDYLSYYLALMNKEDPTPVPLVEELKKML